MARRNREDLEAFLRDHGIDLRDRAFELELSAFGWRVRRERKTRRAVELDLECRVDCEEDHPHSLAIVSEHPDRDVALMLALQRVLELGAYRHPA